MRAETGVLAVPQVQVVQAATAVCVATVRAMAETVALAVREDEAATDPVAPVVAHGGFC